MRECEAQQGVSFVEVMFSMVIFGGVMLATFYSLVALRMNPRTFAQLSVAQATSSWSEVVMNRWAMSSAFSDLSLLPAPPRVSGYAWRVRACVVNPASLDLSSCADVDQPGPLRYLSGVSAPGERLVQLKLSYLPQATADVSAAPGSVVSTTFEVSRREDDQLQ